MNINTDDPNDEPTQEEIDAYEEQQMIDYLDSKADLFNELCYERHQLGAEEYGELTFLQNDVLRMMLEELADTANYCRMQAIKLLILQDRLEAEMVSKGFVSEDQQEVEIGFQAFKGTKEGWKR